MSGELIPMQAALPALAPAREIANPRSDIRKGLIIAAIFFVGFLGWAALAQLDAAAIGSGALTVSGQRQAVQHRDGGVVGTITVKEGQAVTQGQILLQIAAPEVKAQERALTSQAIRLLALRARLESEQSGARTFRTPPEFASLAPEDQTEAMRILQLQYSERSARSATLAAQAGMAQARSSQSGAAGQGFGSQAVSTQEQIKLIDQQIEAYRPLAEKGFVSQTRMRELERMRAAAAGQGGQYSAQVGQSRAAVRENQLQGTETKQGFRARIGSDLREVEIQLGDVLPKLAAAREQVARTNVRAPVAGTVVGLSIFTAGGVVAPGQKLMDIVPNNQPMVIEARFSPTDADDLRIGQDAELRFSGIKDRGAGPLIGKVTRFSADSFTDEKTGMTFYTGQIVVDRKELERLQAAHGPSLQLRAGLPVDVMVRLRPRSALSYLIEPLTDQFWGSLSEQ